MVILPVTAETFETAPGIEPGPIIRKLVFLTTKHAGLLSEIQKHGIRGVGSSFIVKNHLGLLKKVKNPLKVFTIEERKNPLLFFIVEYEDTCVHYEEPLALFRLQKSPGTPLGFSKEPFVLRV